MFKFGKNARPQGPYAKYREPISSITGSSQRNKVYSMQQVKADCGPGGIGVGGFGDPGASGSGFAMTLNQQGSMNDPGMGAGGFGGASGGYTADRYNPVYDFLEEGTILESWIPRDGAGLDMLFRRMYLRDPTLGPGIDLIRSLPWSSYSLDGINDPKVKQIYEDCMNSLNVELLMPDMTGDYLTIGRSITSLIFDDRKGVFSGIVAHDPDFIRVTPLPLYGFDPLCDLKLSPSFRRFLTSTDPRAIEARKSLPAAFLEVASKEQGFLPLDPVSTIYLARKASQSDQVGTSILTRCLYFWAIEKALLNAQMASTRRRSRPFIHLMAGIDQIWEPQADEIDALAGMLMQVNEDPVGGVVATRTGVTISEPVGGGADFYKWSDELELFAKYKMQAIGISDALLNGDATYANQEQARSVFVENLAFLRNRITTAVFYKKLFPMIARLHDFRKVTKAQLDHNIRVVETSRYPVWAKPTSVTAARLSSRQAMAIPVSDLVMPTINWTKQLKPSQDEGVLEMLNTLQGAEYPVTLKQWAAAAGLPTQNMEQEVAEDQKLRATINRLKQEEEISESIDKKEAGADDELAEDVQDEADNLLKELEETTESVYVRSKKLTQATTASTVTSLPIWNIGKCGKLTRTEAIRTARELLMGNLDLLRDQNALRSHLNDKLGTEKAPVMAYVLRRLGLANLSIDAHTASKITQSCMKRLVASSGKKTENALMNVGRCEKELKLLAKMSTTPEQQKDAIKEALKAQNLSISGNLYGGY